MNLSPCSRRLSALGRWKCGGSGGFSAIFVFLVAIFALAWLCLTWFLQFESTSFDIFYRKKLLRLLSCARTLSFAFFSSSSVLFLHYFSNSMLDFDNRAATSAKVYKSTERNIFNTLYQMHKTKYFPKHLISRFRYYSFKASKMRRVAWIYRMSAENTNHWITRRAMVKFYLLTDI